MFANPLWSVLILLALAAIYRFIISPRLRVRFAETYTHIDGWWARQWARIVAFRSFVVASLTGLALALPDLIVLIAPVDFSPFIGDWYAKILTGLLAAFLTINTALKTKPDPKAE